ncbi:helix-turn-helix domain-containing protein [Agrobacterium vitis]|uniref:helix-turn-helix domain-containing protein n=1 Tax=Agrobacterium vitis TaxID=373 RepID=UPI0012E710CB|nr:helix-turn-helix transcriptional regulator [Agrobacterium vitis]MVA73369.1 helix-turn-helix domain-containing protein [Agrobacterium vitis]
MTLLKKTPDVHDYNILAGERLKSARKNKGMSQADVARKLGVTFQQLHKYEKGINGMSASRLAAAATLLGMDPDFFYTADSAVAPPKDTTSELTDLVKATSRSDALELNTCFARIKNSNTRKIIISIIEQIASAR